MHVSEKILGGKGRGNLFGVGLERTCVGVQEKGREVNPVYALSKTMKLKKGRKLLKRIVLRQRQNRRKG